MPGSTGVVGRRESAGGSQVAWSLTEPELPRFLPEDLKPLGLRVIREEYEAPGEGQAGT